MTPKQITHSDQGGWVAVEYGSICPFSAQNKWLLLQHSGGAFGLYTGDGVFVHMLRIMHNQEPRWDRLNPDLFYFIRGNTLIQFNVATDIETILYQFNEYPLYTVDGKNGVTGCGEGDISPSNTALALANGDRTETFTFFLPTKVKSLNVRRQIGALDGLKIGLSNKPIISDASGIFIFDDPGERRLTNANGHAAVAGDFLIWCNSNDAKPIPNCSNGIVKVRLSDGQQTCLLSLDWSLAVDISACDKFSLVSTYGKTAIGPLANKIIKVPLDGSHYVIICDTGSLTPTNAYYNAQPKASLSRDGSRFVFNSNSGNTADPNYCDVFLGLVDTSIVVPVNTTETRIDYSGFVGKSEFVLRPRPDGAVDIIERKLK